MPDFVKTLKSRVRIPKRGMNCGNPPQAPIDKPGTSRHASEFGDIHTINKMNEIVKSPHWSKSASLVLAFKPFTVVLEHTL